MKIGTVHTLALHLEITLDIKLLRLSAMHLGARPMRLPQALCHTGIRKNV